MWHTATSPPWRRRRASAWVRRSSRSSWLARPGVRVGHGELPELVVLAPRAARRRQAARRRRRRADLLQHRFDASGSGPPVSGPRRGLGVRAGRPQPCVGIGHRPPKSSPPSVLLGLLHALPLADRAFHSYRIAAGAKQSRKSSISPRNAPARSYAVPQPISHSSDSAHRRGACRRSAHASDRATGSA